MKFTAALFALMAISSVAAAPAHLKAGAKGAVGVKAGKTLTNSKTSSNGASAANNAASGNATATATSDNSTAVASSSDNSTADASNSTASSTSTASAATRTRPCDQGDQSLAAGLQASVVIGIGQQASILTLQNATAAADFTDGVTRLNQFISTQSLQLQMAQGIADDGSFAQTQLKLLAASQTAQEGLAKTLVDATTSADTLNQLLESFTTSTGVAQDGVDQALIDCFLPLTAVSG